MLRKIATLALAAGLVAAASPALATTVLYGGNTNPRFFTIDDLSDGSPETSLSTSGYQIQGLAWDGSNTLYGGNDTRFFSINVNTNVMTSINASVSFAIQDLAFGAGGVLYGGNDNRFFSIDTSTGAMTQIGGTPTYDINALAYDPVSGTMYGANSNGNTVGGEKFFTIDTSTGAQTLINGSVGENINGMAIDPTTGTLYGSGYGEALVLDTPNFFSINKATGATTLLNGNTAYDGAALAFVPEPGTMLLLGMGLVGLGISGRKKA